MIKQNVDYKTMAGNARLILLGESTHSVAAYKIEAIKALKQLKHAGFTHFAIEMLPKNMQQKIDRYQRTGKGFACIQQYFNHYWGYGHRVPYSYGELVKAARDVGFKIIALDMTPEQMDTFDKTCRRRQAEAKECLDTHTRRNIIWSENITGILKQSPEHRVVAFMQRWHAVTPNEYQIGLDQLMLKQGLTQIRYIGFIGGLACVTDKICHEASDEAEQLKNRYFYRDDSPHSQRVKSFQVHIPSKRLNADGSLAW